MSYFWNLVFFFGLGLAGVFTWIAPRLLSWYASPPVPIGVSCDPAIRWALQQMAVIQVVGLLLGAAAGAVLFFAMKRPKPVSVESSSKQV